MKKRRWARETKPLYDREIFEVLHMIRVKNFTDKEIFERSGITVRTLKDWRLGYENGGTRYPANWRIQAVAEACGFKRVWVDSSVQDLSKAIAFEAPAHAFPKPVRKKKNSGKKMLVIVGGKDAKAA